jgi:hypothetical protein
MCRYRECQSDNVRGHHVILSEVIQSKDILPIVHFVFSVLLIKGEAYCLRAVRELTVDKMSVGEMTPDQMTSCLLEL